LSSFLNFASEIARFLIFLESIFPLLFSGDLSRVKPFFFSILFSFVDV